MMPCERVVVTGSVSPSGTKTTTRTTTYSVRATPGVCVVAGQNSRASPEDAESSGPLDSVEGLKQYIEETRSRLLEDPRTKQMIEKGEATWEEVKQYLKEHAPQRQVPAGPTSSTTTYTYSAGYWYPLTVGGTFTAAPNTVFEVACGDPDITKKISLRPQVEVIFDDKEKQLVFAFDLPGFEKKDVSVEVEKRCIAVSGDRPKVDLKAKYGEHVKCLISERNFGFFCRKFQLPPNALEDTVSATMDKGVLQVRIKTAETKMGTEKKRINID